MSIQASTRALRRRSRITAMQTTVDGWRIDGVGTPAQSPEPGARITVNITATNVSDDSTTLEFGGVESPGGRLDLELFVDGSPVASVTLEAAVTGTDTVSVDITVPQVEIFTLEAGGFERDIRTSIFEPEGDLEFVSAPFGVPDVVRVGESFLAEIEIGCTGSGQAECPSETYRLEFGGRLIETDTIDGLQIADIITRDARITPREAGDQVLRFAIGDQTVTRTVSVRPAEDDTQEDTETAPEPVTEPEPEPEPVTEPEPEPATEPEPEPVTEPEPEPVAEVSTLDEETLLGGAALLVVIVLLFRVL